MDQGKRIGPFCAVIAWQRFGPYHMTRFRTTSKVIKCVGLEYGADVGHGWSGRGETGILCIEGTARLTEMEDTLGDIYSDEAKDPAGTIAVAIPGWGDGVALRLLALAKKRHFPCVVMSASVAWGGPRVAWREAIKSRIVRMFDAALVGGRPQADYVAKLGMPRERVFLGYDVVDNNHFSRPAQAPPEVAPWPGRDFFFIAARFIPEKNLPCLLEAFARYRALAGARAWNMVLLGDGQLRPQLEAKAAGLGLGEALMMPGFRRYPELPGWYQAASCFVLTIVSETWGLVVNEAMAAGLPVLVSNRCGCAQDLVHEGVNGFTFDPCDVEQLAVLMYRIAHGDVDRAAMGAASRKIIADWGPERFARGLKDAVECAMAQPRQRLALADRALLWALIHRP